MIKATLIGTYVTLGAAYLAPMLGMDKAACTAVISAGYFVLAALVVPSH